MDKKEILVKLKSHLRRVEQQANGMYLKRLIKVIDELEKEEGDQDTLIKDLKVLGFLDLAILVRRGQYI